MEWCSRIRPGNVLLLTSSEPWVLMRLNSFGMFMSYSVYSDSGGYIPAFSRFVTSYQYLLLRWFFVHYMFILAADVSVYVNYWAGWLCYGIPGSIFR